MKPKIFLLVAVVFLSSLVGCSREAIEARDINNDGHSDIWIHRKDGSIFLIEVAKNYKGDIGNSYYWDKNGKLLKSVYVDSSGEKMILYEKNHSRVLLDGKLTWKSELDLDKTYSKKSFREAASESYLFTRDNEIILAQHDDNQDGIIDRTCVVKNFKNIDEYKGPYKGVIMSYNSLKTETASLSNGKEKV